MHQPSILHLMAFSSISFVIIVTTLVSFVAVTALQEDWRVRYGTPLAFCFFSYRLTLFPIVHTCNLDGSCPNNLVCLPSTTHNGTVAWPALCVDQAIYENLSACTAVACHQCDKGCECFQYGVNCISSELHDVPFRVLLDRKV